MFPLLQSDHHLFDLKPIFPLSLAKIGCFVSLSHPLFLFFFTPSSCCCFLRQNNGNITSHHPVPDCLTGEIVAGNVTGKDGNHVISQCSAASPCPANEECVTNQDDHTNLCVCRRGFVRDKDGEACRDTNECTELSASPCGMNAFCTNLNGGFVCDCPSGYTGNPYTICYPDGKRQRKHIA